MKTKISDRSVGVYQRSESYPPPKRQVIYDTDLKGFCLVVQPSGVMTFVLRYRSHPDGKSREYKIARFGAVNVAEARRLALKKSGEVHQGIDIQTIKKSEVKESVRQRLQTLENFFDEKYKPYCEVEMRSGKTQSSSIKSSFVDRWPTLPLYELNNFRIQNWRRDKLKSGVSAGGVNRPVSALKAMLNKATEWGVIEANPLATLKPLKEDNAKNVRFLDDTEESGLRTALDARETQRREERARYNQWLTDRKREILPLYRASEFTDYLKPMVLLALNTGLRRGELFNLKVDDVQLSFGAKNEGRIVVRGEDSKSGNTRNLPLTAEAKKLLVAWIKQTQPESFVFPSPVNGGRLDNINKSWKSIIEAAGLKDFRFHDLRHTFASKLAMKGVDLYTIKEFLGHSSIETTQRYAHLAPEYKTAAIAKLDGNS